MDWRADQGRGPRIPGCRTGGRSAFLDRFWANRRVPAFLARWAAPWSRRRCWFVGCLAALVLIIGLPVGFVLWQIQRGSGLAMDMLTPWIARSLSDQMGDGRTVSIGSVIAGRDGAGQVEVEALDVIIHDAAGRRVASVPRIALGLDGLPLLGRPAIRRIDLVGASVALKVGEDGQIALAAGRFRAALPEDSQQPDSAPAGARQPEMSSSLPEPELSPFRRLGIWLDIMEKSGLDGHRLAGFGLRNGTVIVDDVRSGKRFVFAGIDFHIKAPQAGGLELGIDASGSGARWTATATVTPRDGDGHRSIDMTMSGLAPRDLTLAVQSPEMFYADTPISGRLRTRLDNAGDPSDFSGTVTLGSGRVGDLRDPSLRIAIDQVSAEVHWQAGGPGLVIDRVRVTAGEDRAELSGVITPPARQGDPLVVQIAELTANTSALNPHEPPVPISVRNARFVYDLASRQLTANDLAIGQGGDPLVRLNVGVKLEGASPAISIDLVAEKMPLATALALWPRATNPHVRDWVADNMSGGTTEETRVRVEVPSGLLASPPWVLAREALTVTSRLRGTSLRLMPGLSPLVEADIDVAVDGATARLQVTRGVIEPSAGRRLALSGGTFEIPDHRIPDPPSVAQFRLQGTAEAAFALLGQEAFKGAATGPTLPSGKVEGNVNADVTVNVPLTETFDPQRIDYKVEADFTGFAADNAFGEMRVERASFKVTTTPRSFLMRGQGVLGGAQANFEYRKPRPEAKPEIRLTATLDDRGRNRLGVNTGTRITGPTPVRVTTIGEESGRYTVEVDLRQAVLADLLPGWNKARGVAARARFVALETDAGWKLEDMVIESRGVLVRGSATFDDKGSLVAGLFPAYNLSDGDRLSLRVERQGSGHKVTVRGDMIDARNAIRALTDPPSPGPSGPGAAPAELEIDLKVGAVAGSNGEVIRQLEMQMVRRGTEIRSLAATGQIGRDRRMAIEQRGQGTAQRLLVSSGDAGALLRFLDLYKTLQGGDLALVMTPPQPNGTIREGSVEITNFGVRGDQAVSGMVAAAGEAPGAARQQRAQPNDAFAFSRLRANFARAGTQVTVTDGLLWGVAIGATVEGTFDPTRGRLNLTGTYVPAYAINNIFARIPVLGLFLGGSPDEGVFGITYRIAGTLSAPRLTVNPLSAVTPGFLRKIMEFRGRSSVRPDETVGSASSR
ncbi:hypothetical protein [Phreatobacter sp.]|uniref:hypothetical protein n=1 Tax=Phreatobacter sp. TaxID=1966341 RepID=UPI003F715289